MSLIERGWCLAALGRAEEGIPLLTDGLVGWHDLGLIVWRPWALTLLGDAWRMAGQWQAALEHLAEGGALRRNEKNDGFRRRRSGSPGTFCWR